MYTIEELYDRYFKDVYLYIKAISKSDDIAEEITQETFFKAMKSIGQFRGDCDIRVWLTRIAKNTYLTDCEKKKRVIPMENMDTGITDNRVSIENDLIHQEQAQAAIRILAHMDDPYKRVFYLRVFAELSFREIGALYGKTESWGRVTYHRARLKIIKELEAMDS